MGGIMFLLTYTGRMFTCFIVLVVVVLGAMFFPFWGHWGWVMIFFIMITVCRWFWCLLLDWREMYVYALQLSDKPEHPEYHHQLGVDRGFPPRFMWVLVFHDEDAVRIYQGWRFWSRDFPAMKTAVSRGINRMQVA